MERRFQLDEYPLYVKAGSILPLYDHVKNLRGNDYPVSVTVYPGKEGRFSMYEDNGNDKDYEQNFATTELSSKREGNVLTVKIGARKGSYPDMPANRKFTVKVIASAAPAQVTVNGQEAAWHYAGDELALVVDVPETSCSTEKTIVITYPKDAAAVDDGLLAMMRHATRNIEALKYADAGIVLNEDLGPMGSLAENLRYYPARFNELVNTFRRNCGRLPDILKANKVKDEQARDFIQKM